MAQNEASNTLLKGLSDSFGGAALKKVEDVTNKASEYLHRDSPEEAEGKRQSKQMNESTYKKAADSFIPKQVAKKSVAKSSQKRTAPLNNKRVARKRSN